MNRMAEIGVPWIAILGAVVMGLSASSNWPTYWAERFHRRAAEAGKSAPLSVMVWSSSEAFDPEIEFVLGRSDLYIFGGFRVGNPKIPLGAGQYDRIMEVRTKVAAADARYDGGMVCP